MNAAYMDKRGASAYTSLSVRSLDYARAAGDLPFFRHKRKVLLKVADLDAYMARFRVDVSGLDVAAFGGAS